MLLGLGVVLISLDWRLGLVMTLPVPLFCWMIYRHGESLNSRFIRAWRKWSRVTDVLSDTIPGIRVVKAFNQESREIRRFAELVRTRPDLRPIQPDEETTVAIRLLVAREVRLVFLSVTGDALAESRTQLVRILVLWVEVHPQWPELRPYQVVRAGCADLGELLRVAATGEGKTGDRQQGPSH